MKYTIGQIKQMLTELDSEFPEIDENERAADRAQTIKLMAGLVNDWLKRGYSYAQIAEKLRMKGFIRISEKALRQAARQPKRKRGVASPKVSGKVEAVEAKVKNTIINDSNVDAKLNEVAAKMSASIPEDTQQETRSGGFTPRADSDDI